MDLREKEKLMETISLKMKEESNSVVETIRNMRKGRIPEVDWAKIGGGGGN